MNGNRSDQLGRMGKSGLFYRWLGGGFGEGWNLVVQGRWNLGWNSGRDEGGIGGKGYGGQEIGLGLRRRDELWRDWGTGWNPVLLTGR